MARRLEALYLTASYYVKRVKMAATYLAVLYAVLIVLLVAAGRGVSLSTIVSFLTFSVQPRNDLEALATLVAMLINLAPVLGVMELKAASLEEKSVLRAEHMTGHVIVVGYGHLGARVCKALMKSGIPFVLIVKPEDAKANEEILEMMRTGGAVVLGDARHEWVLKRAGVERAAALIITVNDDTLNLVVSEKAKKLNPSLRVIARIYSEDLAEIAVKSGYADKAFSTTKIVYPLFVAACFCDVSPAPNLVPVRVPEGSPLVGVTLREAENALGFPVLAAVKSDGSLAREPEYRLGAGDVIVVAGEPGKVAEAFKKAARGV